MTPLKSGILIKIVCIFSQAFPSTKSFVDSGDWKDSVALRYFKQNKWEDKNVTLLCWLDNSFTCNNFPLCAWPGGACDVCHTVSQPGHVRRAGAGVIGVFRFITSSGQGAPPGAAFWTLRHRDPDRRQRRTGAYPDISVKRKINREWEVNFW